MSATDATAFPVQNQAYRVSDCFRAVSTLKVITGGLTGLAATVSKDGGAFASCANAPVEIGTTGFFTLDLTAAEMNANTVLVKVVATNSGAEDKPIKIVPLVLSEPTGRYDAQTVIRLEQLLTQLFAFDYNAQGFASGGASYTVKKKDGTTVMLTASISETTTAASQGNYS